MATDRRPAILFAEDFDAEPDIAVLDEEAADHAAEPPAITQVELAAARDEAYAEGHRSGLAQAAADRAEVTRQMLSVIADRMADARAEAARVAEQSAESVAQLLLGTLGTVLPALLARHGAGEVAAVARAVLPSLMREPHVTVRVSPHVVPAVEQELARLDPELRSRVELVAAATVPPGDVRITWNDGAAVRDAAALWCSVAEALAPLDLLPAPQAVAA
jgi:flagellar biosynthesis/type III secretory pathway protein FliH